MQERLLVRARNLAAFRRALAERAIGGDLAAVQRRAVVVPTRAAGELLRQTIERDRHARGASGFICPAMLTRDDLFERWRAAAVPGRRWLPRLEREVILARAARDVLARRRFAAPPFQLRPGLVRAMLDFYDELRRRQRSVRRLARVLFDELRVERGTDRGSEGLIDQTRFLGFAFLAYQRAVAASDGLDEHALRDWLIARQPPLGVTDLVIAVADHPADPRGLWPADFDLIGRLSSVTRVAVVMTDEAHDAGFRERLEDELPGVVEVRHPDVAWAPRLDASPGMASPPVHVSRDREGELRDVARAIRVTADDTNRLPGPVGVVFHRPLPYLYLARQVFTDAGVPYQAFDALPLASEPIAAVVDLFLEVVATDGSAVSVEAVLRSPLVSLGALERAASDTTGARGVIEASAARSRTAAQASAQVLAVTQFLRAYASPSTSLAVSVRLRRAAAAVLGVLDGLAEHLRVHDDEPRSVRALASLVHHALEAHTFVPERPSSGGVHLVDAVAARFGEFDHVYLVGLVETDWADRPSRSVFFSSSLLTALGWPDDSERTRAQQAAFRDVLTLARHRARLSAFQLDGDTLIGLSTMVGAASGLPVEERPPVVKVPLFADELLAGSMTAPVSDPELAEWLSVRRARADLSSPAYSGRVHPRAPARYRVSRVDRYVTCPFKYFAADVLRLPEARPRSAGLDPLERGTLLHAVFEDFYRAWQAEGRGAITVENLADAERGFAAAVERAIATLPDADRVLERLRLLGSVVAPGVADRVFEVEIAAGLPVRARLIEVDLAGTFRFPTRHGLAERDIAVRGKADRIDVLEDGAVRVIDYKLGRMPKLEASVQIGVYAHCVKQQLEAADGRPHPVASAVYLAFGDERQTEGRLAKTPEDTALAVTVKAAAFAAAVEAIEAGEFPPRPLEPGECRWCGYAAVCRKEYRVEDADDATEPV